jgi:tetratricopeptide (TPR) repeat protein
VARAVLGTQLARALGLQERYDEADRVLEGIDAPVPAIRARVALERGRLRNSGGHPDDAVGFFENAASLAEAAGEPFLLVDALHMLGIAQPERGAVHVAAALAVLDAEPAPDRRTQRWRVSLHNNRGWALFAEGELTAALQEFEQALRDAERFGTEQQQTWAREAVDECLEALNAAADGAD